MTTITMRGKTVAFIATLLTVIALSLGAPAIQSAYADDLTADATATIERVDLAAASVSSIPAATYTGHAQTPGMQLIVNGNMLTENIDYTLAYQNNTNAGTAKVTATGIGAYQGTVTAQFVIKPAPISSAKASTKTFTYTGKAPKVKVTVKAAGKYIARNATKSNANIKLTVPARAKKVGTHTLTVQGKGNYTGTKVITIKVNPKKTSITSVAGGTKSFTVKWKRPANDISGYEVKYSPYSDMWPATTKTAGKNSASKNVTGLKEGTKYYVQVRAYKNVGGKKYVSGWSAKKSVKTKAAPKASSGGTVYITDTGEKYHRGTCRYLRYSKYAISKSEAQSQGYTACKVCRP